jgi:hypothetical protein
MNVRCVSALILDHTVCEVDNDVATALSFSLALAFSFSFSVARGWPLSSGCWATWTVAVVAVMVVGGEHEGDHAIRRESRKTSRQTGLSLSDPAVSDCAAGRQYP